MEPLTPNQDHIFRSRFPPVHVPNVTLPDFVLQDADLFSDKTALVDAVTGKEYTYREVARDVKRFAKALTSLGLRKGHVVVVVLPNIVEYPIVVLGVMTAGGVFSGANPSAHATEIKKQAEAADATLIITNAAILSKVKLLQLPVIVVGKESAEGAINFEELLRVADRVNTTSTIDPVCETDLCALPFSSGTTGVSKGVMLSHRNLVSNLCSTLFSVGPEMVGVVTTLGLMPFFHIYGITGICCATLRSKGTVVVMERYELRAFLETLIVREVNFAPVVPPIILALIKDPTVEEFDLSKLKLRAIMTAAAPLAPEILAAFERKFPDVQVQEAYGLTEHSCITLTHGDPSKNNGIAKKNSVGFILPNLEMKFIDSNTGISLPKNSPGELCVRSQCVMEGYYKNKEETERAIDKEGWLHTGDIGYIDDDGDVFIVDRIKEMIKYKGFQVAPAELEAILLGHPSIEDAAVVPVNDEEAGEIPVACVVMSADSDVGEKEIMEFVASDVATYKRVRAVKFMKSIPKSPSGKIMRRLLRKEIEEPMNNANVK